MSGVTKKRDHRVLPIQTMRTIASLSVLFACVFGGDGRAQYLQWTVDPTTDRWYGITEFATWAEAEAIAQAQGGHLATIGDAAEQLFVAREVDELPPFPLWIGLNDLAVEGTFEWVDGSPVAYTNWAAGQPDGGDCVLLSQAFGWAWIDGNPAVEWPGIVERGPRPVAGWSFPKYHATEQFPNHLDVGDFDGDGRADVVVANFQSRSISAYQNQGDGTLSAPTTTLVPTIGLVWSVALAQLTGGPALDVAVAAGPDVHVFEGDGAGGFSLAFSIPISNAVVALVARDLDGDGLVDLAATTSVLGVEALHVFLSNFPFGVVAAGQYPTPAAPESLSAGDLDADGDLDLVVTGGQFSGGVATYLNDGTGLFAVQPIVPTSGYCGHAAIADLDADGFTDLAIPSNGFTRIVWGQGGGTFDFANPVIVSTSGSSGWAEAADLDGDGRIDLAITGQQGSNVNVLLSRAGRTFQPAAKLLFADWATCVRALELGGDARPELVALDRNHDVLAVFTNVTLDCNANAVDDATDILLDASLDLDVDGLIDACESAGTPLCFGDGSGTVCPCAAGAAGHGCATSASLGGSLRASGNASVSMDGVQLHASDLTVSSIGLFFQGDAAVNGGAGSVFGDGLRCVSQNVVRLAIRPITGGEARYGFGVAGDTSIAATGAVPALGATRFYQLWFRDAQSYCTSATFNLTNALRIDWGA